MKTSLKVSWRCRRFSWIGGSPRWVTNAQCASNCAVEVEAEIPVLHGVEPKNQVIAKVYCETRFLFGSFL